MALVSTTNVTVSIYAGSNAASPYALGALRNGGPVKGYLMPKVQDGRFGSALYLKWTHWLLLNPTVDIRDAYNSQLDPARNNALGDTVIELDASGVKKTAWYVVFVELIGPGTPSSYLRCYLDRFQPSAWPTTAL
jgi:hypothetical protein